MCVCRYIYIYIEPDVDTDKNMDTNKWTDVVRDTLPSKTQVIALFALALLRAARADRKADIGMPWEEFPLRLCLTALSQE